MMKIEEKVFDKIINININPENLNSSENVMKMENCTTELRSNPGMESKSPTASRKLSRGKYKTPDINKPKITTIGGQKVDLNSDKPQYLKLTIEQIQQLALQQKSGELFSTTTQKVEDEEQHYCAVHSPSPRRKWTRGHNENTKKKSSVTSINDEVKANVQRQDKATLPSKQIHTELKNKIKKDEKIKEKSETQKKISFARRSLSPEKLKPANYQSENKYGTNKDNKKELKNKQELAHKDTKTTTRNVSFNSKQSGIAHECNNGAKEVPSLPFEAKNKADYKTKSPSPSPILSRRALSLPRWSIARSPSPIHRALDPPSNHKKNRVTYTPSFTRKATVQNTNKDDSGQIPVNVGRKGNTKNYEEEDDRHDIEIPAQNESQNTKTIKSFIKKPIRKLLRKTRAGKQEPIKLNIIKNVSKPTDSKSNPRPESNASTNMATSRDISDTTPDPGSAEKIAISDTQSINEENKANAQTIATVELDASEKNTALELQKDDKMQKKGKICKL